MDDETASRIQGKLQKSSYPDLWRVTCKITGSHVVLSGVVRTYHLKQVAQIMAQTEISLPICNEIKVEN
jgi:osmotically-inducible protein OsmY